MTFSACVLAHCPVQAAKIMGNDGICEPQDLRKVQSWLWSKWDTESHFAVKMMSNDSILRTESSPKCWCLLVFVGRVMLINVDICGPGPGFRSAFSEFREALKNNGERNI